VVYNEPERIIILTTSPFPIGLAGTNRILSYCKGFLYHGYQPEVICIRPTEPYANVFNIQASGMYEGIKYSYPGRTTVRIKSFWGRRLNDTVAVISSILLFINLLQKKGVCFSIFYGNNIFAEISFILISWLFFGKIYKEESENPNVYFRENRPIHNRIIKWFILNRLYRSYDCVLVMTHPLRDFFLTKGIPDRKILVVPQTVDQERFENETYNSTMSLPDDYVAYVGSLNQQKDGVLTLVESFTKVSAEYPEIHLILAGEGTRLEKNELSSLIIQLHLNDKVHYIGRISSKEIPVFFHGAKLSASCRPKSIQSEYGFPTKVVEYLASGKPTVTTATGELAFYLKDRVNAFVAKKTDPESFALKMLEVLQDYDFALKVAQEGKDMVKKMFNPITQTKKIIDFCNK